ncbi:hypothetical protein [Sphingomonas sanguinis]|uniref:Uncharacterized protein n=1 Tax=Sphingomonas sanguinis TaxID=33051 RepID=A0A147HTD6_9SPHN|nr:hypothetical protein [Sphingomonas sanguinis]KTT68101.1 hypothetical protein NS319_15440 [Sphingomonas sanguinis]
MLEHALILAGGGAAVVATILIAARAFDFGTWNGKGNLIALPFLVFMITFSQIMGRNALHSWMWVIGGTILAAAGASLIRRIAR